MVNTIMWIGTGGGDGEEGKYLNEVKLMEYVIVSEFAFLFPVDRYLN